jgi:hypothetical protein
MRRRLTSLILFAICAVSVRSQSQSPQLSNPALRQQTIDAAALGVNPSAFTEYGLTDNLGWSAITGLPFAGGVLRAGYTNGWETRVASLGYARTIARQDLGAFGTLASGLDVVGAYNAAYASAFADRTVRAAIPLSLRWGSPSALSLAPYVAPFVERGRRSAKVTDCEFCVTSHRVGLIPTRGVGVVSGLDLTVWHLGFDFASRDAWGQRLDHSQYSAGMRWNFSR